ncbi:Pyridoxal kinase [Oopsacas minuta]|uniref:Pyridoxal kinase n=1 Tax=Oopsacas minuta TaxID=111878 RepID=A0AAV7KED7_9METZ|nr:Pyridoxal kinase [Oopsacas minuta]
MAYDIQRRVLSIQSHVVHGYCGNRSATFPLQVLGYEVDCINTVQFSNHTQYKSHSGSAINEEEILQLIKGLKDNQLFGYTHMLTGYTRSSSVLSIFTNVVEELREANKDFVYLCDPVLGDHGLLYVPDEMIGAYKKTLHIPNILTPNQFELELLTGMEVVKITDAIAAINSLHKLGPKTVVITSFELEGDGNLYCIGSQLGTDPVAFKFPKLEANFVGSGDLFAALFLGWFHMGLKTALKNTLQTMQSILHRTLKAAGKERGPKALELQLVRGKQDIETPPETIELSQVNLQ